MRVCITAAAVLLFSQVAYAGEPDELAIKRFVVAGRQAKQRLISDLQRQLANATSKQKPAIEAELSRIESGPLVIPKIDAFALRVGDIGWLDYGDHVVGVAPRTFRVVQVLNAEQMLIRTGKRLTLVRGLPTAEIDDGSDVTISKVMHVVGNATYRTAAGGTNTVLVAEPFDHATLMKVISAAAAAEKRIASEQAAAEKEQQFRTWVSRDGRFTVEARLVSFAGGKATLERRDGKQIDVSPALLSPADNSYIRDELRRRKATEGDAP